MIHIDEWIDDPVLPTEENTGIRYAKWFFIWKRMPAWMQSSLGEFYNDAKLFCEYQGKKYRCAGASRMGDIWLTSNFNRERGYELRVNVDDCSGWSKS